MNIQDISLVILSITLVVLGFCAYDMTTIKKRIYQAMLVAKDKAKDGILKSGIEQKEWVVEKIYLKSPKWIKKILGKENLSTMIERMYSSALDLLDDGKLNDSVKE